MIQRKSLPTTAIEGTILTSTPFEETSHIICLFSKEQGRVKFVTKQSHHGFSPLLRVEALVVVGEKELWKCRECRTITSYPRLRLQLQALRAAAKVSEYLCKTLPLHLPLSEIYALFLDFLEWVPHFDHPHVAATAFLVKFCIHEGIFPSEPGYAFTEDEIAKCHRLGELSFEKLQKEREEEALFEKLIIFASG